MKILSIETSCDETAISILSVSGKVTSPTFTILGNHVASQIALHQEYGGVFPALAKREHGKAITPLLMQVLSDAQINKRIKKAFVSKKQIKKIETLLAREEGLFDIFMQELTLLKKPTIDAIAVTNGPGLEPALWVGISFAKALSVLWDVPVVPVNHMEGHVLSVLIQEKQKVLSKKSTYLAPKINFPALTLLVSGGHTELVTMQDIAKYRLIGQTRDDACGEAFDKVARMLDIPYPGGPKISLLADQYRKTHTDVPTLVFPRPMIHDKNFDFSFSGLKTAVLYHTQKAGTLTDENKAEIACAFEDAVVDVLVTKTIKALKTTQAKTLVIGGGVAGNTRLKKILTQKVAAYDADVELFFPEKNLSTDNSLMIGIAGYFAFMKKNKKGVSLTRIRAEGNMRFN